MIPITVIKDNGTSCLVEFIKDGINRVTIPSSEIRLHQASEETLYAGIPYGYNWEDLEVHFSGSKFAENMHNLGLWTAEDVLKKPQLVWSAIHATLGLDVSTILQLSSQENKRSKTNGR